MTRNTLLALVLVGCCPQQPVPPPTAEGETVVPDYNRDDWGRWKDEDHDCQDTRQEVLIAESLDPVTLDEKGCRVLTGRWVCPYTGKTFTDPGLLDIDHILPLREVHYSGGWAWTKEQKEHYFNYLDNPDHLRAVDRSANRSKGSRQPDEWLPPNQAFVCEYLRDWTATKIAWNLEIDCDEGRSLSALFAGHCR